MDHPRPAFEPKSLYRRLDRLFGSIDPTRPPKQILESFVEELYRTLKEDLLLSSVVLYGERRDGFERMKHIGDPALRGADEIQATAPLVSFLARRRFLLRDRPPSGAPADLFGPADVPGPVAAILIGEPPARHVLIFALETGFIREEVEFALNTVRVALSSRLLEERVRGSFVRAGEIQRSLLLDEPPAFPEFDIACRTTPAEEVGGDFYDFMPFDGEIMGIAIGDASGHGLPAALLVRDVVTGLRMGIEKDMKMGYVFQKLNRVVHRSRLTSRFVSVFYGELERNGNFLYVNAGHNPPLLFLAERTLELSTGGTVIGPLAESRFKRGFAHVDRGATLLLYTDGIIERRNAVGELYGMERMTELVRHHPEDTAAELLDRLFRECDAFGTGLAWDDDATAIVVRRALDRDPELPPPSGIPSYRPA